MLKVLVTGKDGQLAQCIKSVAHQYPNLEFDFKASSELDITNKVKVESALSVQQYDYCINCAAYTNVDNAETETELAYKINVIGAKNLAEACLKYQVTLVHISTDFVFDGKGSTPYTENSNTKPIGVYGETKLKGEIEISKTLENHFILRTSWLYSEFGNNFLKTMLRLGSTRDELGVVGDQIGSPTYAVDLANVILRLIASTNTSYGIYHYSNKGVISWYGFAKEIFRISESNVKLNKIETKDYPTKAERPKYSVLETSKITKTLGLEIPNWKESLVIAISKL
ncbi:dTDP-4-dehydrorhamnose reductase [uncultured Winogradskyella sp.]|uniref:dTDP-4-dehydrorhamnose reductase n=1 Tax=uncultured Winogradskyella sp. TaxID=395353 RepID=UPI00261D2909|nr:dTDP-4-dehydrorhamnose reductase [uncultured Winogradskyella sp.]